jgi:hypothetical protein
MTLEAKATILWILSVGLAVVVQIFLRSGISTDANSRRFPRLIDASLASVALALIAVGVASGTLRTHLVQISPLVLLLAFLPRSRAMASAAAAGVLSWWLVTMVGIWLFLLGMSRFLTGTFSPTEILLTLIIGVACMAGLSASGRAGTIPLTTRVSVVVLAAGLQSLALWFSYQPIVIGR